MSRSQNRECVTGALDKLDPGQTAITRAARSGSDQFAKKVKRFLSEVKV